MLQLSNPSRARRPILHLLALLAWVVVALAPMPARAVELTGQLRGQVTDADGLAIPGVSIDLSSPAMQGHKTTQTDSNGRYFFAALPPGKYTAKATMEGLKPAIGTARVVAGFTEELNLTMVPATATEEITVVEEKPTVDVTSTRTGVVMTKEMLRDIPNPGRDYQAATAYAPGVVDNGTGNPNIRGGLSFGNQYYIDGINTTDPVTNTFSTNMNYDAIEEVQVITGGMDAEYGRALGGAVNVVTRSGGNQFEGDVQLLYQSTRPQIYKPLPDEVDAEGNPLVSDNRDYSFAANLGGPIQKDKLWFFTGVQLDYNVYTPYVSSDVGRPSEYPMQSRLWKSAYLFGKVTWRPSANQRLWIHAQADPTTIDNVDAGPYVLPNADTYWTQGGWIASIGDEWTPNAKTIVETQLFQEQEYLNFEPMAWKDCVSVSSSDLCDKSFLDSQKWNPAGLDHFWQGWGATDFSYGPYSYKYLSRRPRSSLTFSVTRFVDFLGAHQFKAGVQGDIISSKESMPGAEKGIAYYTNSGDSADLANYTPQYLYKYEEPYSVQLQGKLASWYVQDVWHPVPRLTLRPGVRFDWSKFINNDGQTVFNKMGVGPRFGAAYDLTGDGRTSVHAYYGRFYDSGFLDLASTLSRTATSAYYGWSEQTGTWSTSPAQVFSGSTLAAEDLIMPWSDKYDVGVSRDLGDGWGLSTDFTYESTHNLWEDDEVNLIWDSTGTNVVGSRDGTGAFEYRLRTPDEAFIRYTSLEVSLNRQFDEHWGMLSSYTWSHAYGRARDDLNQGMASAAFDIPELQKYEVGLMPYDVPHQVKVAGSYRNAEAIEVSDKTALGFLLGWNFRMSSGTPYEPAWEHPSYGYVYRHAIDGSYRLPAYSQTDVKVGLTLAEGKSTWDLTAEVFNLFNTRTVTSVQTAAYGADGTPTTDSDGNLVFGQVLSRQNPRYLQLGLRGEF